MAIAPVFTSIDSVNGATRVREHDALKRTDAEIAAGVTPVNYAGSVRPFVDVVLRYGLVADGVTDNQAAMQAAINAAPAGAVLSIPDPGTYYFSGGLEIDGKAGLEIWLGRNTVLLFEDGDYAAFLYDNAASRCELIGGFIRSTNTTTPELIGVKWGGNSAYMRAFDVEFSYCNIAMLLGATYIDRIDRCMFSSCNQYIKSINSEGSNADIVITSCGFNGSSSEVIGTDPFVDIQSATTELLGNKWETQTQLKASLVLRNGCQSIKAQGAMTNSGGVIVETNVIATLDLKMHDSWYDNGAGSLVGIVVASGADCTVTSGSSLINGSIPSGAIGVSSSGNVFCIGVQFKNWTTGWNSSGGLVNNSFFQGCTAAIDAASGSTVGETNIFSGCTTNITGGGTIKATSKGATAAVADGGTITHGHPKMPTSARVTSSVAGEFASVTAIGATTITVALKKHDNTAGTTQTVYWDVSG